MEIGNIAHPDLIDVGKELVCKQIVIASVLDADGGFALQAHRLKNQAVGASKSDIRLDQCLRADTAH